MPTGTGKTYTAFQIIWRLWKGKQKKRILFLADRNILVDQTRNNDFKPFGAAMTKISKRQIDTSYEIYLSLYQAVSGNEEEKNIYKQFSPRSEEHTSELQSLMRTSYAVFCLKKTNKPTPASNQTNPLNQQAWT